MGMGKAGGICYGARAMSVFGYFREKMEGAGQGEAAIRAFERSYEFLVSGEAGMIGEGEIEPPEEVADYGELPEAGWEGEEERGLLGKAVVIKLNGGLGTSMGLRKAKSLLEVKAGRTFLDVIAGQALRFRERTGVSPGLLLMNSFSTSADTLKALGKYGEAGLFAESAAELEMMQNQAPKVDAGTLRPAEWPADPALEWCPPGHGDLYPALAGSGWLEKLLGAGVRYAFVSNSDNLGAVLDARLLRDFAASGAPFLMEVTRRTEADRKGGHLARRKGGGRLLLREVAQCPEEDAEAFQDTGRHRYFNTNNLWVRLDALKEAMEAAGGALPLPVIKNAKTVDPRDKASPAVWHLETAMGAAIECFDGARAVCVPRSRFAPVKTTGDLLALRSDAYEEKEDGSLGLVAERDGTPPVVSLGEEYKMVDGLAELGVPSLRAAKSLAVEGAARFAEGVVIEGEVRVRNPGGERKEVAAGTYRDEEVVL